MKAVVIYDSVSPEKVTAKVAEVIVEGLRENGVTVDSFFVDGPWQAKISECDCLILGAPTMAWKPSERMKKLLADMDDKKYPGKMAATFDTQVKSALSGNATKHMAKSLEGMGFKIVVPDLIAYVESKNKAYRLKEGEQEKAKKWAKDLAEKLK